MLQEQLQQRWQQLNSRERSLVSIAGVVLLICVIYFALWQPLQNGIEQRELQRSAQQDTLSWVRENTGRYLALSQQGQRPNSNKPTTGAALELGDIPRIVTEQARAQSLELGRMSPEGEALVAGAGLGDVAQLGGECLHDPWIATAVLQQLRLGEVEVGTEVGLGQDRA